MHCKHILYLWETAMSFFYQNSGERLRLYTSVNNTFSSHLHRQAEMILVLEGGLFVTDSPGRILLTSGQGILIFPNRLHSLYTDPKQGSRILLCIFESDFCPHYRSYLQNYLPVDGSFDLRLLSRHSQGAAQSLLGLTECYERREAIPPYLCNLAEGYLSLLLAELFTAPAAPIRLQEPKGGTNLELEQRVLLYLDRHFTEELSLELLAREFGISRFQLSRLFSEKFQTTFPRYVNSRRLEYARELLAESNDSVTNIALDAGFGSSRSFFREFREAFHTTPSAYRRQHIRQAPRP